MKTRKTGPGLPYEAPGASTVDYLPEQQFLESLSPGELPQMSGTVSVYNEDFDSI